MLAGGGHRLRRRGLRGAGRHRPQRRGGQRRRGIGLHFRNADLRPSAAAAARGRGQRGEAGRRGAADTEAARSGGTRRHGAELAGSGAVPDFRESCDRVARGGGFGHLGPAPAAARRVAAFRPRPAPGRGAGRRGMAAGIQHLHDQRPSRFVDRDVQLARRRGRRGRGHWRWRGVGLVLGLAAVEVVVGELVAPEGAADPAPGPAPALLLRPQRPEGPAGGSQVAAAA
mmetsp:Transcript_36306/g.104640  ORF Transcript_36306/g.104640 Transcript_36306/m.104640 type:complete len:228 (-) Transcript_36306:725-1408(-)